MAKTITMKAKDLCKLCSLWAEESGSAVGAEHVRGGKARALADLRPDVTKGGKPSLKTIGCTEDGAEKWYPGNYEFFVSAFIVGGHRLPLPDDASK